MSQYNTGSAALTNGSAVVTGTSTAWLAAIAIADGFTLIGSGITYDVQSVDSDTQITLSTPYTGVTGAGLAYTIIRDFTAVLGLPYPVQGDVDTASVVKNALNKLDAGITIKSFNHRGDWLIGTTYAKDDSVANAGRYFVSKVAINTGHTPPATPSTGDAWWGLVSDRGQTGIQGIQGIQGNTGPAGSVTPDVNGELIQNQSGAAAQVALGRAGARKRADGSWDGVSIRLPTGYDLNLWADNLVSGQVYNVLSPLNAPSTGWWHVEILRHDNDGIGNQYRTLRITAMVSTGYPNGTIFTATSAGGTWSAWHRIATDEPLVWITPTFVNGWANYGLAYGCSYAKDSSGTVFIKGLVKNGSNTTISTVFTLPIGMRPTTTLLHNQSSTNGRSRVDIDSLGNVTHYGVEPHSGYATTWLSMQATFKAEQ